MRINKNYTLKNYNEVRKNTIYKIVFLTNNGGHDKKDQQEN